jgi:PPOX class probable FMN-dependent enzyme
MAVRTHEELRERYAEPRERSLRKQLDHLDPHCRRFVELSPFCVLATCGPDGLPDATPRGGEPGFVHVLDEHTLLLPDRPGNNRLDSLGNLTVNPGVGLLFFVPGVDETLRVNGTCELRDDPELVGRFDREGKLPATVLVVSVQEAYLHCAKALMRSRLWDPEAQVERSTLPSLGEMLRDQLGLAEAETQEQMLERYRQSLY